MTRAAIYTRVSTEEQATGGTSLEVQQDRCRAYCAAQGWEVHEVYTDAGVSGAKASRPALDALLADVRSGTVRAIVVAKLDRLGRSVAHLAPLVDDLDSRSVALVSVAEAFDSGSPGGRMLRGMLGLIAEWERDTIRERTSSGRRRRVEQGGWGGGDLAPYGYRIVGEGPASHLEVDPAEAAMFRRVLELVLDHGMTTGEAARALNAEGHTPRNAPRWSSPNLRNVLRRAQLAGTWTYGKGTAQPIDVAVPPIVDAERWEALRRHLADSSSGSKSKVGRTYPLTGRLLGTCGHPFHGIGRADRTVIRYRCTYARDLPQRDERCPEPTVRADDVDLAVFDAVTALLRHPDQLQALAEQHLERTDEQADDTRDALLRARERVQQLEARAVDAAVTFVAAGLDADGVRAAMAKLNDDVAEARTRVRLLEALQPQTGDLLGRAAQVHALAVLAEQRLTDAPEWLRDRVYRALGVRVTILDHGGRGGPRRAGKGGSREPLRLRIEGRIDHASLLTRADTDWHLSGAASARA